MQKKKVLLKHMLEYSLFRVYIFKVKILPHFFIKLDRVIILFLFKMLSKRHSFIVDKNLKIVFPDYGQEDISVIKKGAYSHFSRIFLEII